MRIRREQIFRLVAVTLVAFLNAGSATAEMISIQIDGDRSRISFTLGATLHTVRGTVPVVGGTVRLDTGSGGAVGSIAAATSKANTGNEKRDRDMHTKVLESTRFSSAEFVFDRLEGNIASSGKSTVTVHGQMRVHGASHPMSIPATLQINGNSATADASFSVPYVKWGMKDPSKPLLKVEKSVKVNVHLAGSVKR